MKRLIPLSLVLFLLVGFLQNCTITKKHKMIPAYSERAILIAYGEKIYQREGCNNCHTQEVEKASTKKVSLDGLGGKYSNDWFYFLLSNPRDVIPGATMPSYSFLNDKSFDQAIVANIKKENQLKPKVEVLLDSLRHQSEGISEQFQDAYIDINYKETLALIAYLQQIPKTDKKKKLDSMEQAQRLAKEKMWLDSVEASLQNINDKETIASGKVLFQKTCSPCHGQEAQGIIGPNLTDEYWLHGGTPSDISKTIFHGVLQKGMPSWKNVLSTKEVSQLVAYIYAAKGSNPPNPKEPQGEKK